MRTNEKSGEAPTQPQSHPASRAGNDPAARDTRLRAIADRIVEGAPARSIGEPLAEITLETTERLSNARAALDVARRLETAGDPRGKEARRAAFSMLDDERIMAALLDRAVGRLSDVLALPARIRSEEFARINTPQSPPAEPVLAKEDLRKLVDAHMESMKFDSDRSIMHHEAEQGPSQENTVARESVLTVEPSRWNDPQLRAIAQSISENAPALSFERPVGELSIDQIQRILDLQHRFDEVRELEAAGGRSWKENFRAARAALNEERKLQPLQDRVIARFCESLCLKDRICIERVAKNKPSLTMDRKEQIRALLGATIEVGIWKARQYNFPVPALTAIADKIGVDLRIPRE